MKILVTGASGFLGRAVVRRAAELGHDVAALVRPAAEGNPFEDLDRVTIVRGDLRQPGAWREGIDGAEVVIHCAAAPSGDLAEQFSGTVVATENLLASLPQTLQRLVHVSSFSVYDFASLPTGSTLDEKTPLEPDPERRDAYTWTKMIQERMVVEHCGATGTPLVVIRPGAIFGPGKDWDFGSAMRIGRFDLIFAPLARFRLTYVDNCADAILAAASSPAASGQTINIVDDDLPSHAAYHRACRRAGGATGRAIYVPWWAVAAAGLVVRAIDRVLLGGRARVPEFLAYRRQQARWKRVRYSNALAKQLLGWSPRVTIAEGVARTIRPTLPVAPSNLVPAAGNQEQRFTVHRDDAVLPGAPGP